MAGVNGIAQNMPRRILFAIGTETYTDNRGDDRDMVPDILGGIVDLLTPLGFETRFAPSGYLLDPGRNVFREAIRRPEPKARSS